MTDRRQASIRGTVQGVGFRPFVARLAADLDLGGHVCNDPDGVAIEIEGPEAALDRFGERLHAELPAAARIREIVWRRLPLQGERRFRIDVSVGGTAESLAISPDLAPCSDCLSEIAEAEARRHRYPFTNCTRCGPRFTIVERPPYDRCHTSMASFRMCQECAGEYADARDRRYHAQPIACPLCGPRLALRSADSRVLARSRESLEAAARAIEAGEILALKGVGGYQLLVRADDEVAVERLRRRKHRPAKPLAVLVADLQAARPLCHASDDEREALTHPAAPIVLLRPKHASLAPSVAPGCPRLGVMLPASPLHALLAQRLAMPLVCTSGNPHEEPLCIDDSEALTRLATVADVFLVHDRPIVRPCDDSVVQIVAGRMRVLRAGRGLAPARLPFIEAPAVIAVGAHLKHAPVFAHHRQAVLWPHVGDLDTLLARQAMHRSLVDGQEFLGIAPAAIACDLHPDYASSAWAHEQELPVIPVQHHHAHIASVLAESGLSSALGFAWDGMGLGADHSLWGGETLAVHKGSARRVASLACFGLPGGDAAARDGERVLAGMCLAAGIDPSRLGPSVQRFAQVAASRALSPPTSSVGRLFDGVAALTGVTTHSSFEGEAAMALEAVAEPHAMPYDFRVDEGRMDWRPALDQMIAGRRDPPQVASRFHATLLAMMVELARRQGARRVALSGGCFQNHLLAQGAVDLLAQEGIEACLPERVSPGDGGLALGQAWVAAQKLTGGSACV